MLNLPYGDGKYTFDPDSHPPAPFFLVVVVCYKNSSFFVSFFYHQSSGLTGYNLDF